MSFAKFCSEYAEIICSTLLAALAFVFELFINKKYKLQIFIKTLMSLPREMMMLSMGFIVSFILSDNQKYIDVMSSAEKSSTGLVCIFIGVILTAIIYGSCEYTNNFLDTSSTIGHSQTNSKWKNTFKRCKYWFPFIFIVIVNLVLSIAIYILSVSLFVGGEIL